MPVLSFANIRSSRFNFRPRLPAAQLDFMRRMSSPKGLRNAVRSSIRLRPSVLFQLRVDTRELERRMDRMQWKAMREWGGMIGKKARSHKNFKNKRKTYWERIETYMTRRQMVSINEVPDQVRLRFAKAASSPPGTPPYRHRTEAQSLKRIKWDVDRQATVPALYVGPMRFPKPGLATKTQEYGDTTPAIPVLSRSGRKRSMRIPERSYMRRAFAVVRTNPKFMEVLRGAL